MSESTVIFIEGIAAVASAVIVFCGSVWLLLMLILGARLAYFITATITLGVLLIMGVVWSINQLGPVGELPSWSSVAAADQPAEADFSAAATYPDSPWKPFNKDDAADAAKASELESEAGNVLEKAIAKDQITTFASPSDALVNSDETRFLEQGGKTYGGVTFEAAEGSKDPDATAVVFASYDPGNPLGPPRQITAGIFVLFLLHLFGLSRIEKRAKTDVVEAT